MMTEKEIAGLLESRGWKCSPPWTKETCPHPPYAKVGQGSVCANGASTMHWSCLVCGKAETLVTPPNPQNIQFNKFMCWG
jgi:hypothetical protein